MKSAIRILLLLVLASTAAFAGDDKKVVYIATEEYPPYTSERLKHFGIDDHIVSEAFRNEGIEVVYQFYPGARSFEFAKNGEVDGTIPWAKREDRDQFFHYSDPVIQVDREQFFYRKGLRFDWNPVHRDYSQINGKRFAAIISYNYGKNFQKAEADGVIHVERVNTLKQAFRMLLFDRVDMVISKGRVATYELQSNFAEEEITQLDSRPENVKPVSYDYLLFSKKRPNAQYFLEAFNRGLKKLYASGKYNQFLRAFETGGYIIPENR